MLSTSYSCPPTATFPARPTHADPLWNALIEPRSVSAELEEIRTLTKPYDAIWLECRWQMTADELALTRDFSDDIYAFGRARQPDPLETLMHTGAFSDDREFRPVQAKLLLNLLEQIDILPRWRTGPLFAFADRVDGRWRYPGFLDDASQCQGTALTTTYPKIFTANRITARTALQDFLESADMLGGQPVLYALKQSRSAKLIGPLATAMSQCLSVFEPGTLFTVESIARIQSDHGAFIGVTLSEWGEQPWSNRVIDFQGADASPAALEQRYCSPELAELRLLDRFAHPLFWPAASDPPGVATEITRL